MGILDDLVKKAHEGKAWTECKVPYYTDQDMEIDGPGLADAVPAKEFWNGQEKASEWPCEQWMTQVYWNKASKGGTSQAEGRFNITRYRNTQTGEIIWVTSKVDDIVGFGARNPGLNVLLRSRPGSYTTDNDPILNTPIIDVDNPPAGWRGCSAKTDHPEVPCYKIGTDAATGKITVKEVPREIRAGFNWKTLGLVTGGVVIISILAAWMSKRKKRKAA